jgi:hypothetical protein
MLAISIQTYAQQAAVRTNLAYDATLTPNIGAEVWLDSAWSLKLGAGLQAWDLDSRPQHNKKLRHLLVSAGARRYHGMKRDTLCIYGHRPDGTYGVVRDSLVNRSARYFELNGIYSHFNVGNFKFPFGLYKAARDKRLQGDLIALGGKYGYSWMLSRTWAIEAEAGVAVGYAWFKEYDCPHCGSFLGDGDRIFLLPQLGINVVYIIN